MKSLSIIRNEHRNLGAVLYSLETLLGEIEKGKNPDFQVFHGLLTYIDRFLDEYHHPKEELYLFPVLRKRCPEISAALDERQQEHHDGEKLFAEVLKALSAYEFLGGDELDRFGTTLRRYTAFERKHAMEEEKRILPAAEERLTPGDWEEIDAAFMANEDPLFGHAPRVGFESLHSFITSLVPAPYGLGAEWQ
ncbi:MAG: hemerythrin domain-containing protein [Gammaproteobacteria bacterium]|nr:hemerythrin domain-containing protein [Gammaproteobacteria bacterium]